MRLLGHKRWFPSGLHPKSNISKTLDKQKMQTEVIPNTQDFNETALNHF